MLLHRIGECLYGQHWQPHLAKDLLVNDRTLRRWAAGTLELPSGVWKELFIKLDARRDYIDFLINAVKEKIDLGGPDA